MTTKIADARHVVGAVAMKTKVFVLDGLLRPHRDAEMVRLGSYYGGWWIPRVDPTVGPAVCVGAGLDVTFDLELTRVGYTVYTVDPTPAAVEYVQREAPHLTLIKLGVWDRDTVLEFVQSRRWWDSWSVRETAEDTVGTVETFPVCTLATLLADNDIPSPGLIKIDIEGAEHRVVRSMLTDGILPPVLCVEFDDRRLRKIIGTYRSLRRAGYRLRQIENLNFVFSR